MVEVTEWNNEDIDYRSYLIKMNKFITNKKLLADSEKYSQMNAYYNHIQQILLEIADQG